MASRGRRKSFTGEEDDTGRGPWTDVEKRKFLEGLAKYGKDFKRLTAEIGTREIAQVRRYYSYHKSKMMDPSTPASPSSSRKRKDTDQEGVISATVNPKRTKKTSSEGSNTIGNVPLAKMPAGPSGKAIATPGPPPPVSSHPVQQPLTTTRRRTPAAKASAKLNAGQDIIPPANVIYTPPKPAGPTIKAVATPPPPHAAAAPSHHLLRPTTTTRKRTPAGKATAKSNAGQNSVPPLTKVIPNPPKPKSTPRNNVKPARANSKVAVRSSPRLMKETKPSWASMKMNGLLEVLRRESVQSVMAGLFGFLAVLVFKKFVG